MLKTEAFVEVGWKNRSHLACTHCIIIRCFKCSPYFTKMPKIDNSNALMSRYISTARYILVVESNDNGKTKLPISDPSTTIH